MLSLLNSYLQKKVFCCYFSIGILVLCLNGCQKQTDLCIGTLNGAETELMKLIKVLAIQKYGIRIKIIEFQDESSLNIALHEGSIDANLFQNQQALQTSLDKNHYDFTDIGPTFIYPMGIYSDTLTHLKEIKRGFIVGLPKEAVSQARALRLLENAALIKLKKDIQGLANLNTVQDNPYQLKFKSVKASDLPKTLPKVHIATLQAYDAFLAKLSADEHALFQERPDKAYVHLMVTRTHGKHKEHLKQILDLFEEETVFLFAKKLFNNRIYRVM